MPVDPQVQQILDLLPTFGITELSALPVDQLRAVTEAMSTARGEGEPVAETRDLDADGVPCRLYRPAGSSEAEVLPVVVFLHGGGWVFGSVASQLRAALA